MTYISLLYCHCGLTADRIGTVAHMVRTLYSWCGTDRHSYALRCIELFTRLGGCIYHSYYRQQCSMHMEGLVKTFRYRQQCMHMEGLVEKGCFHENN